MAPSVTRCNLNSAISPVMPCLGDPCFSSLFDSDNKKVSGANSRCQIATPNQHDDFWKHDACLGHFPC